LGQGYVRDYWWSAVFGGVEVATLGTFAAFVYQGKTQTQQAYDFADKYYAVTRFANYYDSVKSYLVDSVYHNNADSAQAHLDLTFIPQDSATLLLTQMRQDSVAHSTGYYNLLRSETYVQGWEDCEPRFETIRRQSDNFDFWVDTLKGRWMVPASGSPPQGWVQKSLKAVRITDPASGQTRYYPVHQNPDSLYLIGQTGYLAEVRPMFGSSAMAAQYNRKISSANAYYRSGERILILLLVNHIVSAIDAGFLAKRHNDALLGKETVWDHLGIEQVWVSTTNGPVAGLAMRISF
jgi:hypothetical protein